jgi:branched-chain amino acid transport system ATP-binding protein
MGLAPVIIDEVFRLIEQLKTARETTMLLVEQLAYRALEVADRAYVLEQGVVRLEGPGRELMGNEEVQRAYLGARKN